MSENFNPAACTITRAVIISFDGQRRRDISFNFIGAFEINQSMDAVAYSGNISVLDTAGVLEGLPIRGEETLELEIVSHDLDTKVSIITKIHRVTDIEPVPNGNGLTYRLHFISTTSFESSTKVVTAAYRSPIYDIAKDLFEKNFSELSEPVNTDPVNVNKTLPVNVARYVLSNTYPQRNFYLQPTYGIQQLVIPRLLSSEAMYFVASRAFNSETPSQTFRFFETLENYYFVTDEYFLKNVKKEEEIELFYAPVIDYVPEAGKQQVNRIDSIRIVTKGIDTSTNIYSGAYKGEVIELDFIRRKKDTIRFDYENAYFSDMSGNPTARNDSSVPHSRQFRETVFNYNNAKKLMFFRNYATEGDIPGTLNNDLRMPEIALSRISYYHHLHSVVLSAALKGRLDLRPGQIVNLNIAPFNSVEEKDAENDISGRYLIKSTTHTMSAGSLTTGLVLVKFDWTVKANERRIENASIPTNPFEVGVR